MAFLDHPDPAIRRTAITGLGDLRERAIEAVPALEIRLKDPDWNARSLAARSLALVTGERREYEGMPKNADPVRDAIQYLVEPWFRGQGNAAERYGFSSVWVRGPDDGGVYVIGPLIMAGSPQDLIRQEGIDLLSVYLIVQGFLVAPGEQVESYGVRRGND